MNIKSLIIGYLVSSVGGALVLWLLVDKIAWGYLTMRGIEKKGHMLTFPMGIIERILYTTVFLIGQPDFVGVWLLLKVASQWQRWQEPNQRGVYNVFLIGNGLSLLIAFIGAWLALGKVPLIH